MNVALKMKFMSNVQMTETCWLWLGTVRSDGYARFIGDYVHRISYRLFKGAIPGELTIDHLCRNKSCVNPKHLEAVTLKENIQRAAPYSKSYQCNKGHSVTGDNAKPNGLSIRCRACHNAYQRQWKKLRRIT